MTETNNNNIYYNRLPFLQKFPKELTLVLPAQEIKPIPPLSPLIAQFGLNAAEVCEKFNKETTIFPSGLPIATSIYYKPKEKNFNLSFRPFQLKFILQWVLTFNEELNRYQINLLDLYKIIIIKGTILCLNKDQQQIYFRNILGTLRSYERPIEILISPFLEREIYAPSTSFNLQYTKKNLISNLSIPFEQETLDIINIIQKEAQDRILKEVLLIKDNSYKIKPYLDSREFAIKFEKNNIDLVFYIKKNRLKSNKKRTLRIIEKKKKYLAFNIWENLPYSLLLYAPKLKDYHYLRSFLYCLNQTLIIRKQRFFFKKNKKNKNLTSFFSYKIFFKDFYELYNMIAFIEDYDISILGIEFLNQFYDLEDFILNLTNIKINLQFLFNYFKETNNSINQNIQQIFNIQNEIFKLYRPF